ncbi:hypothetical protein [Bernardetia sp.]|uniref:hypothetical protein n=1 Tax=Bernardetia sp. TaxID=1937974 RepID=UPI0025C4965C|nr:hypothetical protein [Bernardetia sp.]
MLEKIVVQPIGGLCNRLRAIESVLHLLKTTDKTDFVTVIWENNHELGASYKSLFKENKKIKVVETLPFTGKNIFHPVQMLKVWNAIEPTEKNYQKSYRLRKILGKEKGCDKIIYLNEIFDLIENEFDFNNLKKYKSLYIVSCFDFEIDYPNKYSMEDETMALPFSSFIPHYEISEKINKITHTFTEATIGLHIRRTDHAGAIEKSPLSLFIEKMNEEIADDEKTNFFLATDEKTTEKELIQLFGNRIIINKEKAFDRDSEKGVQDAYIDVACLSKTSKIYGSHASSFSETAAKMGEIELIVCKK